MIGGIGMTNQEEHFKSPEKRITELEVLLSEAYRSVEAIEAAGFDIWENNFVTGETFGTNERLFSRLGYSPDEIPKTTDETFAKIHPDDLALSLKKVQEHVDGLSDFYQSEMRIMSKSGQWVWTGSYGKVIERNEDGDVTRIIGLSFNINERRIMEETMKEMAYTDALTSLGNRRMLYENGRQELERCRRYNSSLSLLFLDMDNFKIINDTYGHIVGDKILETFADILIKNTRQIDIKIRYGGDEFVVLLIESEETSAKNKADQLCQIIAAHDFGIEEQITISAGYTSSLENDTIEKMISRSDEGLYKAKKAGRNCAHVG